MRNLIPLGVVILGGLILYGGLRLFRADWIDAAPGPIRTLATLLAVAMMGSGCAGLYGASAIACQAFGVCHGGGDMEEYDNSYRPDARGN